MGETGTGTAKPWPRLLSLIALAGVLTAAIAYRALELSMQIGRLSLPPLYDDVSYFVDGAKWLNAVKSQSLIADVSGLVHSHAPFSTLAAAIGLRLMPDGYAGLYVVHAAWVGAFLLGIVWLTWRRPFVDVVTCLIAAASVPVVWHTITEGRPDLPLSLALGLAVGAIVCRGVLRRSLVSLAALGVGCGLAVSIKPSAFPASLLCVAGAFAIRLLSDGIQSGGPRTSIRRAAMVALCFALGLIAAMALLLGPALLETLAYIYLGIVEYHDFWIDGRGFWIDLLRYSVGGEGRVALQAWLWVGLVLMVLRLLLAARDGRAALADAVTVMAAVAIAYAIPSLSEIKTYFYGAIFYGVFVVAMALNYCACQASIAARLVGSPPGIGARRHLLLGLRALPLAAVALLFVKYIVLGQVTVQTVFTAQQRENIRTGTQRVWSLVREAQRGVPGTINVGFSSPYPVTASTIQLYAEQAEMKLAARQEFFHRTIEATETALLQSDLLVISSTIPHNLPGPRFGDELIRRMDANKDVCLLDSLTFSDVRMRVYRRPC